jgi:hypothetical protein
MSDTADLRQKADTCLRLADVASSARANELFKRLAEEYRAQAAALEGAMASPPLAPPAVEEEMQVEDTPVASEASLVPIDELVDVEMVADQVALHHNAPDDHHIAAHNYPEEEPLEMMVSPCQAPMPQASMSQASMPEMAASLTPQVNSAQWLAELQALRNRL